MIFVTVGGQKPFPRLVDCVDAWAAARNMPPDEVFAQIGTTTSTPRHLGFASALSPGAYRERFEWASVVVAHAGMGTILTAIDLDKPILVMPRRASQGEHRNDHQQATARQLEEVLGLCVAWDEAELSVWLDRLEDVRPSRSNGSSRAQLISFLRKFIAS